MSDNGAPTLMSGPAPLTDIQLATADTDTRLQPAPSEWGIYLNGKKKIEPTSIIAIEYTREWAIADFQIEDGGFGSYDKVARPFDVHLRITKGGSEAVRRQFLSDLEVLSRDLDLLDIVTPVKTYLSVNIARLALAQTAESGATLLKIDLGIREVRVTAGVSFSHVASPDAADPVSGGTVQPQAIPAATQEEIKAAVKERLAEIDAHMFDTPAF